MIGFKALLIEMVTHDLDSTPQAFGAVAREAFGRLREEAKPKLLEPIMKVEVVTPEEYTGSVIADLNRRRGLIRSQDMRGDANVFDALVPLANLFGYQSQLKALTQGGGKFRMAYSHYQPVPQEPDDDPDFSPAIGMRA